jgi:flagellar biosynthesis component FlhA
MAITLQKRCRHEDADRNAHSIDYVAETHPKLTEELVPNTLSVSEIQKGLQIFYARRFQFEIS